jgi:hypothetical protein
MENEYNPMIGMTLGHINDAVRNTLGGGSITSHQIGEIQEIPYTDPAMVQFQDYEEALRPRINDPIMTVDRSNNYYFTSVPIRFLGHSNIVIGDVPRGITLVGNNKLFYYVDGVQYTHQLSLAQISSLRRILENPSLSQPSYSPPVPPGPEGVRTRERFMYNDALNSLGILPENETNNQSNNETNEQEEDEEESEYF